MKSWNKTANQTSKTCLDVSQEQSDWKNEVNDAQEARDYITSTIEENKRESERVGNTTFKSHFTCQHSLCKFPKNIGDYQ